MNGQKYVIENNDGTISMKKYQKGQAWLGCVILLSILFWATLIGYLLWRWGHLIDGIIVFLILFLIFHVIYTFTKKG